MSVLNTLTATQGLYSKLVEGTFDDAHGCYKTQQGQGVGGNRDQWL